MQGEDFVIVWAVNVKVGYCHDVICFPEGGHLQFTQHRDSFCSWENQPHRAPFSIPYSGLFSLIIATLSPFRRWAARVRSTER